MRILVLSLLRLGDLLQQKPLLDDLRRRNPGCTIDLLVNPGSLVARELIAADRWIVFERDRWQRAVMTAEVPMFAPVREVEALMRELSSANYDLLLNFSHNRLSAFLAGGIDAKVKKGLLAEGNRFRTFENSWLRHYNERAGWKGLTPFHSVEILASAFGLEAAPVAARGGGRRVLLQPLTSDTKKNWPLENWSQVLEVLRAEHPRLTFQVLGAPFEEDILKAHFAADDLFIADLKDVSDLMADAALVLSGDTSIKHLAVLRGVPLVEIALGSADSQKTGAFATGGLILQSTVACAPCPHSSPCRRPSHECGDALGVGAVLAAARRALGEESVLENGRFAALRPSAVGGEWVLANEQDDGANAFADAFEKTLWRAFLDGRADEAASITDRFFDRARLNGGILRAALDILTREQDTLRELAAVAQTRLSEAARLCVSESFDPNALNELRRILGNMAPASRRLRVHLQDVTAAGEMPFAHPLAFFGYARRAVEELGARAALRARCLQILSEKGDRHERQSGKLPERGPEAT